MDEGRPLPAFVTHYYHDTPFASLTDLDGADRARVISELKFPPEASHRFQSAFYFEQRLKYENQMYRQFVGKGGSPDRRRPYYAVLGRSEIWESITPRSIRIPLSRIPPEKVSFTYTDSWFAYVEREADGTINPRKPQYGTVYRLEELNQLFARYGWPGDRWKNEAEWQNDIYVEAQLWANDPSLWAGRSPDATA